MWDRKQWLSLIIKVLVGGDLDETEVHKKSFWVIQRRSCVLVVVEVLRVRGKFEF